MVLASFSISTMISVVCLCCQNMNCSLRCSLSLLAVSYGQGAQKRLQVLLSDHILCEVILIGYINLNDFFNWERYLCTLGYAVVSLYFIYLSTRAAISLQFLAFLYLRSDYFVEIANWRTHHMPHPPWMSCSEPQRLLLLYINMKP